MKVAWVEATDLAQAWSPETVVKQVNADAAVSVTDTREDYEQAARAWLAEHEPGLSDAYVGLVLDVGWDRHTGRTVRVELTATELRVVRAALAGEPIAEPAVTDSLTAKLDGAAARLGAPATGG